MTAEGMLKIRRINYDEMAYCGARADLAIEKGDMKAFRYWASRYHGLQLLLNAKP